MTNRAATAPKPPLKPLQHRTISASVAEELRRRIVDGEFQAGFQLRQEALAVEFGISRIPVREALMQLEAEGLVKIHPHRGAIVSALSPEEVEELFELRALLEPRLLEASAPHLAEADYQRLTDILREYSSELHAMQVSRWGELNREFHMVLYQHAVQPRSLAIVANLLQECDRHTRLQLTLTDGRARAEAEHDELLRLCVEGQIEQACKLLKSHIEGAGKSLLKYIHEHQQDGRTAEPV
ncbi:DNA-binding GntR family transcriptional regulator [Microvirga lupini]|uniref:DNA-binding GntR family transcriptional regulator n=1 Tax=Microvirga lupini TaxID=420324 RepID=A0A7W4YWC5_9HYPH|nr:GntR family transcriptional regulator [Microvirga lupini]MBB3019325.1 DNA-binding GntR family transcriptional regulator [Microvirga lupini]